VLPEKLEPPTDEPGRAPHHLSGLRADSFLIGSRATLLHEEFEVGLDRSEIDVLGITAWWD
jgi:hypothetical protein